MPRGSKKPLTRTSAPDNSLDLAFLTGEPDNSRDLATTTLLRLPGVQARTGLGRTAVYSLEGFPKPVRLGGSRSVAWISTEVDAWIAATIAASRHPEGNRPSVSQTRNASSPAVAGR